MNFKYVILLLFSIIPIKAHCQNYKSVVSGDTTYYASKGYFWPYSNTLRMIYISNSLDIGPDSMFYFYPTVRPTVNSLWCLDTLGPTWFGEYLLRNNLGEEKYQNMFGDIILLKTLSNINDSWKIVTDSNSVEIWGTVIQQDTMTIDNQLDSIKSINLQAYINQTPQVHDYNNRKIILSKNHGFVVTLDFFTFPYSYLGTYTVQSEDTGSYYRLERKYTERKLDDINFIKKFQSGNYWQYVDSLYMEDNVYYTTIVKHIQDSVISSYALNAECFVVDFYTISNENHKQFIAPNQQNPQGIYTTGDTVLYTFHTDTICNATMPIIMRDSIFPETRHNEGLWMLSSSVPIFYYFTTFEDSLAMFASFYHWNNNYGYNPNFNCITNMNTVSGQKDIYLQYLEGFGIFKKVIFRGNAGGGATEEDRHFYHNFFKIGNDTFGTPLNLKVLSLNDKLSNNELIIYPNPSASGQFNIQTNEKINWEIYSLDGKLIISGTKNNIDLSKCNKGIYFLKLNMKGTIYFKKLFNSY